MLVQQMEPCDALGGRFRRCLDNPPFLSINLARLPHRQITASGTVLVASTYVRPLAMAQAPQIKQDPTVNGGHADLQHIVLLIDILLDRGSCFLRSCRGGVASSWPLGCRLAVRRPFCCPLQVCHRAWQRCACTQSMKTRRPNIMLVWTWTAVCHGFAASMPGRLQQVQSCTPVSLVHVHGVVDNAPPWPAVPAG